MSYETTIHPIQTLILKELLFRPSASYSELQKLSGLDSDHFKFHLKKLVESSYIAKHDRSYRLTVTGKEYANKLDTDQNVIERQPKSAVILVVRRTIDGKDEFLVQERLKHPYYGFWGFPSGKVRWGETILTTASRELHEETGLYGEFEHRGIYHERVIQDQTGEIIEDKVFHMMFCDSTTGTLTEVFQGGKNAWLSLDAVRNFDKRYKSFDIEADIALKSTPFTESIQVYSDDQF
jgi:ADP-ribose pyrophosphatase YjhB (NUDIX family)